MNSTVKYKDFECFLEYKNVEDNLMECKSLCHNRNYQKKFDVIVKKRCLEIYGVDSAHFLSTPGLAWQAALKKTKVKLDILTDIDLLFLVEEGDRGGIYHAIHQYHVIHNNTWKILIKSKNLSI